MRIAGVIRDSLVNGEGLRDVVFVQGCPHYCINCHNKNTWDFDGGKEISPKELADMFKDSPNDITISGGEPFAQLKSVAYFMWYVRMNNPNKKFWVYTGYNYEYIEKAVNDYLLPYVEVIVDGQYVEKLKDPNCLYRGSTNQRLIDVKQTVASGNIVLWEDKNETQL